MNDPNLSIAQFLDGHIEIRWISKTPYQLGMSREELFLEGIKIIKILESLNKGR